MANLYITEIHTILTKYDEKHSYRMSRNTPKNRVFSKELIKQNTAMTEVDSRCTCTLISGWGELFSMKN